METYRILSRETYPRCAHLDYFCTMAQPYAGLTVPVDITAFYQAVGARKVPFFLSFLYCAARAANGVPELRQAGCGGRKFWMYDHCPHLPHCGPWRTGRTVIAPCAVTSRFQTTSPMPSRPRKRPRPSAVWTTGERRMPCPSSSSPTLPWVHYEALVQPTPSPADTNPRITWGRFRREGDRVVLPVSLLCHHGLVDGLHMAHFYANLEKELAQWVEKG